MNINKPKSLLAGDSGMSKSRCTLYGWPNISNCWRFVSCMCAEGKLHIPFSDSQGLRMQDTFIIDALVKT